MAYAEKRGKDRRGRVYYRGRYLGPTGKWESISRDKETGQRFFTKRAAEQAAEAEETDVRRKTWINPADGKTTLTQWAEAWLKSIEVAELTMRDYRSRLNAVILPRWGETPVADITAIAYSIWEQELRAAGYAENSIDGVRSLMRTMLDDAVTSKVRGDNPIPNRKKKRRGRYKKKGDASEEVTATPRQALLVARNALALRGFGFFVMVLTIAYTGMRMGEVAGLTRDRLILPARRREGEHTMVDHGGFFLPVADQWEQPAGGSRVLVDRQSQYVEGQPGLIVPKYESTRSLIIPWFLADLLLQLVADREADAQVFTAPKGGRLLAAGDWYSGSWWPVVDGTAPLPTIRGRKARAGLRPVLGVEGMRPHGLRHSHKVWLDEQGHPRVAVETRMGHEIQGSEGTYSHVTLPMELAIADGLQRLWEESLRPVVDRREYGRMPREADQKLISQKSPRRRRKVPQKPTASPAIPRQRGSETAAELR